MKIPDITAVYAAILMLIYVALSFNVVRLRRGRKVGFGDGGHADLRCAIRAHAHFGEYVPFILFLVAIIEMAHAPTAMLHGLLGALLVARILHPLGIYAKPGSLLFNVGRVGGMVLTTLVMIATALATLAEFIAG